MYRENTSNQISQGDILKKFPIYYYNSKEKSIDFLELSYCIIITQDCDLTQDYVAYENKKKYSEFNSIDDEKIKSQNNKLIPSIMLVEGFPAEQLREGTHLSNLNMYTPKISNKNKTPWKNIIKNETPRYHYLKEDKMLNQSEVVFDFKRYYTVSRDYIYLHYHEHYTISLNELYREHFSTRFASYLSRIGLP